MRQILRPPIVMEAEKNMRKGKLIISFFIFLISGLMSFASYAAPEGDPVLLLRYIADNMIEGLKTNKATLKTKPQIVYNLAYRFVVPYADLPQMSKHVLSPRVWNSASAGEKMQFQKEFTRTVIRTYASALSSYQDQSVRFYPVRGGFQGRKTVEVSSDIISSSSQPIHVTYRLVRVGSIWKLYDMSVEGVDMLESFHAQFADMVSRGSMNSLLHRISQHNR